MSSYSGPFNEGVLTKGLVLSYDADELASFPGSGTTLTDISPSKKDAIMANTSYVFDYSSVTFDGAGDFLTVPSSTTWNCAGDFTIEAWVYQSNVSTQYIPIMVSAVNNGFWFGRLATGYGLRGYAIADYIQSATAPIANTWYHVAVSRQGTTMRLFINGKLEATVTNSITFGGAAAYIGSDGGAQYMNGLISNFRIVNGTALYTTDFVPPAQHLQPVAGTALLTCQTAFIDGSTNKHTVTANGNAALSIVSPFNKRYRTFRYNGTNAYAESAAPLPAGQQKYTISAWFKTTTTAQVQSVWEQANGATSGRGSLLIIGTAWGFNGQGNDAHDKVPVHVNRWTHGTVVVDTTDATYPIKLYENGVLYWRGQPSAGGAALSLGATVADFGKKATVNGEYFSGDIASVAVYNRSLSDIEVSQLYDANCEKYGLLPTQSVSGIVSSGLILHLDEGIESSYNKIPTSTTWSDLSGRGNNATLYGGLSSQTNTGFTFNGTSQYASLGKYIVGGATAASYSAWFTGSGNIINEWAGGAAFAVVVGGSISTYFNTNGTSPGWQYNAGSGFSDGNWHEVCVTYNGSNEIVYVDGKQLASYAATGTIQPVGYFKIGANANAGEAIGGYFAGQIAEVKVYNRALSATEVLQNFNARRARFRV